MCGSKDTIGGVRVEGVQPRPWFNPRANNIGHTYLLAIQMNEGNKKMFWKEVKRVRKGEQARDEMVKYVNCQILRDSVEVRRRWAEYFEQVLNVADVREANINVVGN